MGRIYQGYVQQFGCFYWEVVNNYIIICICNGQIVYVRVEVCQLCCCSSIYWLFFLLIIVIVYIIYVIGSVYSNGIIYGIVIGSICNIGILSQEQQFIGLVEGCIGCGNVFIIICNGNGVGLWLERKFGNGLGGVFGILGKSEVRLGVGLSYIIQCNLSGQVVIVIVVVGRLGFQEVQFESWAFEYL